MQKSGLLIGLFSVFLILGIVAIHAPIIKAEDSENGSDDTKIKISSEDSGEKIEIKVESENKTEDDESSNETQERTMEQERERAHVEVEIERDGQKLKIEAKGLTAEQVRALLQDRNRLMLHANDSNLPEGCESEGATLKCEIDGTREMTIHAGQSGNTIFQVKGVNASTNVTLYKSDNGTVYGIFGNETRPIELPDAVRDRVRERIRARIAENESIQLEEDGNYSVEVQKESRFLGIFPVHENVHIKINAENGDVLNQRAPWWSFLAKDVSA